MKTHQEDKHKTPTKNSPPLLLSNDDTLWNFSGSSQLSLIMPRSDKNATDMDSTNEASLHPFLHQRNWVSLWTPYHQETPSPSTGATTTSHDTSTIAASPLSDSYNALFWNHIIAPCEQMLESPTKDCDSTKSWQVSTSPYQNNENQHVTACRSAFSTVIRPPKQNHDESSIERDLFQDIHYAQYFNSNLNYRENHIQSPPKTPPTGSGQGQSSLLSASNTSRMILHPIVNNQAPDQNHTFLLKLQNASKIGSLPVSESYAGKPTRQQAEPPPTAFNCAAWKQGLVTNKEPQYESENYTSTLRDSLFKFKEMNIKSNTKTARFYNEVTFFVKKGSPEQAEAALRHFLSEFFDGRHQFEPNNRIFTKVICAWRKSHLPEASDRCKKLLKEMFDYSDSLTLAACAPDTFCINVVLFCIVESGQSDVATYVGTLFRNMKGRYLRGNETFRPDAATYNVVLGAYTREMKMDEAELFLEEIISDHLSGNRAAKPMMQHFHTMMNMFARSKTSEAHHRAALVLQRFQDLKRIGRLKNVKSELLHLDLAQRASKQARKSKEYDVSQAL